MTKKPFGDYKTARLTKYIRKRRKPHVTTMDMCFIDGAMYFTKQQIYRLKFDILPGASGYVPPGRYHTAMWLHLN